MNYFNVTNPKLTEPLSNHQTDLIKFKSIWLASSMIHPASLINSTPILLQQYPLFSISWNTTPNYGTIYYGQQVEHWNLKSVHITLSRGTFTTASLTFILVKSAAISSSNLPPVKRSKSNPYQHTRLTKLSDIEKNPQAIKQHNAKNSRQNVRKP